MTSLPEIARILGGEVRGDQVLAPGPGHSPKDRSLSIKLDTAKPHHFVVHSFCGDDPIRCKQYVRRHLGLSWNGHDDGSPKDKSMVGTYDYTDETGELLFQVVRFVPKCLTDGQNNFLWVYINDEGFVTCLTRYMPNGSPGRILQAISEAFDTDIFSEYESQFWGFETQEEWDAWEAAAAKESEDRFYANLVKYVDGEPNDINPGTIGEIKAKIAKTLACEDHGLVAPS
jgi:hypothetical protein